MKATQACHLTLAWFGFINQLYVVEIPELKYANSS